MRQGIGKGRAIPVEEDFFAELLTKAFLYDLSEADYDLGKFLTEDELQQYLEK